MIKLSDFLKIIFIALIMLIVAVGFELLRSTSIETPCFLDVCLYDEGGCYRDKCLSYTKLKYLAWHAGLIPVIYTLCYKLKQYELARALTIHLFIALSYLPLLPSPSSLIPNTPIGRAATAFADANSSLPSHFQIYPVSGFAPDTMSYAFLFDVIKETSEAVSDKCTRCVVDVEHHGQWEGSIAMTTDGSDPSGLNCEIAKELFACRRNEDGPPGCDLFFSWINNCVSQVLSPLSILLKLLQDPDAE